jgi:hypothetical protein
VIGKSGIPVTNGNVLEAYVAATSTEVVINTRVAGDTHPRFQVQGSGALSWGSGTATPDATVSRTATGQLAFSNAMRLIEITEPSAPPANCVFLYAKDNGSGKTGVYARFPTGAVQQVALEP